MKPITTLMITAIFVVPLLASAERHIEFTPIQHATFVIQFEETTIYVDPVGDADAFKGFPTPDIILVTDIHSDHLDAAVVDAVKGENTVVVGPRAVTDQIEGAVTLNNGETQDVRGVSIEAVPMYNLTSERLKFHDKGRGNGYVVTLAEKRVYISGDTEDIPEMRALENIDYAFVCMNLPYTMTVEQAASAVLDMKPRVVYPYHYRGTDGMSDTKRFKTLLEQDKDIEVRQLDWYKP